MSVSTSRATSEERESACRLLVSVRPTLDRDRAAQHYLDLFDSRELDPSGLFVARGEGGAIRGAMVVQEMPGALGLAWAPTASRGPDRTAIEDSLVATSCNWLRSRGVKVCQAFAGESDCDAFAPLVRYGFARIAKLADLRWELGPIATPDSRLSYEPLDGENRAAFTRTLLETFEGSLDCPEITGTRTDEEVLEGYLQEPAIPEQWFAVRLDGKPLGVVLLDRSHDPAVWELTYLGIAPRFRGRGLGAELVKFALQQAANRGAQAMQLSVDSRNAPALRLYQTLGFQASGEREVFLAHWPRIS